MKRGKQNIKRTIKKKIELRQGIAYLQPKKNKKMGTADDRVRTKTEITPRKKPISFATSTIKVKSALNVALSIEKNNIINAKKTLKFVIDPTYKIKDYGRYKKKRGVDYDVIFYIPTYNRFEKINRLLTQIYTQETKYSFKVILLDDGSTEEGYKTISKKYSGLTCLLNTINGGKANYWLNTNKILKEARKYKTHALIQIDDDFILCSNFLNILMDEFFKIKKKNNQYMAMRYHYGHRDKDFKFSLDFWDWEKRFQSLDGGSLFDTQFMELINYTIDSVNPDVFKNKHVDSRVWYFLNNSIKNLGVLVYTTKQSLALHDGNDESKMHSQSRYNNGIYTKNFIDDTGHNT